LEKDLLCKRLSFLSPIGIPIEVYPSKYANDEERSATLSASMNEIFDALGLIHSKRICHNDVVSPKNILIREVKDSGTFEAFLIDFGISTEISYEDIGYMGTPCFSPQCLRELSKNSKKDTDLTALALSTAWLMKQGDRPWKSIEPSCTAPDEVEKWAQERFNIDLKLTENKVGNYTWLLDALQNFQSCWATVFCSMARNPHHKGQ
jgi:serine/threonine protein kinase